MNLYPNPYNPYSYPTYNNFKSFFLVSRNNFGQKKNATNETIDFYTGTKFKNPLEILPGIRYS